MSDIQEKDPQEEKFRRENQWYSFTGALYGAVGGASFIGLLGMLAQTLVKASVSSAGAAEAMALLSPIPAMVIGGLMALGTVCVYMSQREYTELKCIGDEHLAQQNAKCMELPQFPPISQNVEYEKNCRTDGKSWGTVVAANQNDRAHSASV